MKELTLSQKSKFLACLTLGLSVTKACKESGVPRRTAYYWRAEDDSFRDAWDEAIAASVEELEDHLRKRAMDIDDPKSHILLIFLLKKLNPEYKENYKAPEKTKHIKPQEFEFGDEEIETAISILNAAKTAARKPLDEETL